MRCFIALLAVSLLVACGEGDTTSPRRAAVQPVAIQTFEVSPVRSPGGTVDVVVTFPLAEDVVVTRTELVVAGTKDALLPSPWGSPYKINGHVVFEGRSELDASIWMLKIEFRNESVIVCSSCDPVMAEYRLWE